MPKPNFFVIGAAKSATTSLCSLLQQHPNIFFSDPKEPRFYQLPDDVRESKRTWYEGIFLDASSTETAVGEGSVCYTFRSNCASNPIPSRIKEDHPEAKFIYIVRHPIDRIVSNWLMVSNTDPNKFRSLNSDVVAPEYEGAFVDRSLYWSQINDYREIFKDEQILVLFYEDFRRDPNSVLDRCFAFLGLSAYSGIEHPQAIQNKFRRMTPVMRFVSRLPSAGTVQAMIPQRAKTWLLEYTNVIVDNNYKKPRLCRETWQSLVDRLREDSEEFLSYYKKPTDHWSWKFPD
ncbi:sulfotransferase family protein [Bremerella sp. P1]|uniref:sulfotransferase family protein n=1 Tax=Bremerella sp. P1 TaxID=3026424 RepID=UPI0023678D29|nr:sulfotransferase [Bremerella sp. P1]WDI40963.1 sulfotransferase [Bremerella sp. P1]